MPHELNLPKRLKAKGWKVKIREKERLEPPHVTILCGKREWRVGLRDKGFLVPPGGKWADIDDEIPDDLTWIAYTRQYTDELLKAVSRRRAKRLRLTVRRGECVLTVASPRAESVPTLHGLFARIVGDSPGYRWLPKDELSEVLF